MRRDQDDTRELPTVRIPSEDDTIKAKAKTWAAIGVLLVGGSCWATKMTLDMAQVRSDVADIKSAMHISIAAADSQTKAVLVP